MYDRAGNEMKTNEIKNKADDLRFRQNYARYLVVENERDENGDGP